MMTQTDCMKIASALHRAYVSIPDDMKNTTRAQRRLFDICYMHLSNTLQDNNVQFDKAAFRAMVYVNAEV